MTRAAQHAVRYPLWVTARAVVWALVLGCVLGCVTAEHRKVEEALLEKERCVSSLSASHPNCLKLAERVKSAQQLYEVRARQAWGCDPAQKQCPPPR
jgi:hypothetical protein